MEYVYSRTFNGEKVTITANISGYPVVGIKCKTIPAKVSPANQVAFEQWRDGEVADALVKEMSSAQTAATALHLVTDVIR